MKKLEITAAGKSAKRGADRIVVEAGALVLYGRRGAESRAPGQWERAVALDGAQTVAEISA